MPIEQLLTKSINARDFQPVEERQKSSPEQRLDELKATPLYDYKFDMWYRLMNDRGIDKRFETQDHLWAIYTEGLFDKKRAKEKYQSLKNTAFYSDVYDQWRPSEQGKYFWSRNQLLGIVIEEMFDKEAAQENYESLKKSKLYDRESESWYWHEEDGTMYIGSPEDHLLGIMAEALFDREKAKKQYEKLKRTDFYDTDNKIWAQPGRIRHTDNQLLGILVESVFNKEEAFSHLNELKDSPFYDKRLNQWNEQYTTGWNSGMRLSTKEQLLDVIIEATLEEPEFAAEKPAPLPEVRVF